MASDEIPSAPVALPITDDAYPMERALRDVVRATQSWVQMGTLGFAILCILIGAVEALFGK
jgi:hypothetical protein